MVLIPLLQRLPRSINSALLIAILSLMSLCHDMIILISKPIPMTTILNPKFTSNNSSSFSSSLPTIPHQLFFNYKRNLLMNPPFFNETLITPPFNDKDKELAYNVNRTIRWFREAWNITNDDTSSINNNSSSSTPPFAVFLNDTDCVYIINQTEPRLLRPFLNETGPHKSDICRIVYLYENGGYYLDNDIGVIQVPTLAPHITFSTVLEENGSLRFFQAFTAATVHHPILHEAIQVMIQKYENQLDPNTTMFYGDGNMGTWTLRLAYQRVIRKDPNLLHHIQLFQEVNLWTNQHLFPHIPRNKYGAFYNMAVVDVVHHKIYFWSRLGVEFRKREGYNFVLNDDQVNQ